IPDGIPTRGSGAANNGLLVCSNMYRSSPLYSISFPHARRSAAAHANTTTMKNFHCRLTAGDYHAARMKMMVGQAVVTIYLFALIVNLPQIALPVDAVAYLGASAQCAHWSARD